MELRKLAVISLVLITIALTPSLLLAQNDRVHFFQDINVGPDEHVGSLVCLGCSIHMEGTSGDAVAILGSIMVDGTINGDAVAVAGGIKLGEDSTVSGDTVGLGWGISRHPNATVKGEVVSQSGPLLFAAIVIIPFLPIILIIWLVVWLLRRPPAQPAPAYRR